MKFIVATPLLLAATATAFAPNSKPVAFRVKDSSLNAKIRGPTEKSEELRFGTSVSKIIICNLVSWLQNLDGVLYLCLDKYRLFPI